MGNALLTKEEKKKNLTPKQMRALVALASGSTNKKALSGSGPS